MNRSTVPALLVCVTFSACGDKQAPAKSTPPAAVANPVTEAQLTSITLTPEAVTRLGIQTVTTVIETVTRTRSIGGEIMAPPGGAVLVSAPTAGTLQAAAGAPRAGARVTRGQVIFMLYAMQPPDRNLGLESSRDVATAEAELVLATQRAERLERLLADGAVSARAVEEARAQQKVAAATAAAARSRAAEIGSSPTGTGTGIAIRAPISGMVQSVAVAAGQTVAAAAPLFAVVQTEGLWVRVPLFVGERGDVDTTRPITIEGLAGTGPALTATPVAGPATSDPLAATSDLFYALPPASAAVRPGDRVTVRVPLTGAEQALVVPTAGVVYDLHGGSWVYEATGPNAFIRRRIDIRSTSGAKTLVARGIEAGKQVVTDGAAELFGTEFGAGK